MTQLWAWEYEGKTEFGEKELVNGKGVYFNTFLGYSRPLPQVTNLRKVKVVDEDCQDESHTFVNDTCKYCGQNIPITKTYLTTKQFIVVWKSLDDDKYKELNATRDTARDAAWYVAWYAARDTARDAAWYATRDTARDAAWDTAWDAAWYAARDTARDAAWCAAWDADLAIVVRDKITPDQFNTLVQPWTSCGLSLYAEDWDEVLSSKVAEPTGFGAIVEAECRFIVKDRKRFKFVRMANGDWYSDTEQPQRQTWSDLINPTIISEGIEG